MARDTLVNAVGALLMVLPSQSRGHETEEKLAAAKSDTSGREIAYPGVVCAVGPCL